MGLIAFPFILCLLSSPFVVGGIIFYMWRDKKRADRLGELMQKQTEARLWYQKRFDAHFEKHGLPMSDRQSKELEEEAKKRFGLRSLSMFD